MIFLKQALPVGLLAGLLAGASSAALAQAVPPRGPIPFAAYDSDGNGVVTEEEFAAVRRTRMEARMAKAMARCDTYSARTFERFDTNGDGQLSPEELAAGQRARMERRQWMRTGYAPGMGPGMGMGRNRPAFSEFDLDDDGLISEAEFNAARSERIRKRTQQGYRMRNLRNAPTFADLDTDDDGQISAEEFAAHQRMGPPMRGMP